MVAGLSRRHKSVRDDSASVTEFGIESVLELLLRRSVGIAKDS